MPSRSALVEHQKAPLTTPSDIELKAVKEIAGALNAHAGGAHPVR